MRLLKDILKFLVPCGVLAAYRRLRRKKTVRYTGDYPDWQTASAHGEGYDAAHILEKVKAATQQVLAGNAVFERDSVLFREEDPNWPLLVNLLLAAEEKNTLDVLDFGGSLGSVFFQNRKYLARLARVSWRIVEQPHFVQAGRELFAGHESIGFHDTFEEALAAGKPDVILFSSVLQYIPGHAELLRKAKAAGCRYIFIDRLPLFADEGNAHRFCVQHVPEEIYKASYPIQIFQEKEILPLLSPEYRLADKFLSYPGDHILESPRAVCRYYGLIFRSV